MSTHVANPIAGFALGWRVPRPLKGEQTLRTWIRVRLPSSERSVPFDPSGSSSQALPHNEHQL